MRTRTCAGSNQSRALPLIYPGRASPHNGLQTRPPSRRGASGAYLGCDRVAQVARRSMRQIVGITMLSTAVGTLLFAGACGRREEAQAGPAQTPAAAQPGVPQSIAMGGAKSVTTFFVTSRGLAKGGDLGGLAGADAHCQALAKAEGSGDHTWRAYLSTSATANEPAVNARDRIGKGPWYNAEGFLVAANLDQLHSEMNAINKET